MVTGGGLDEGLGGDADGGVHPQRLDEQRQPEVAGGLQVGVEGEDGEVRGGDPLEPQQLLGQALVLPDVQLAGAAAPVANTSL